MARREKAPVWWEAGPWSEDLSTPFASVNAGNDIGSVQLLDPLTIEAAHGEAIVVIRVVGQIMLGVNNIAGAAGGLPAPVKWRISRGLEASSQILASDPWLITDADDEFLSEGLLLAVPAAATATGTVGLMAAAGGLDQVAAGADVFAWPAGHIDVKVNRKLVPNQTLVLTFSTPADFPNPTDVVRAFGWLRVLCRAAAT